LAFTKTAKRLLTLAVDHPATCSLTEPMLISCVIGSKQ
jgi:hypothetical protein